MSSTTPNASGSASQAPREGDPLQARPIASTSASASSGQMEATGAIPASGPATTSLGSIPERQQATSVPMATTSSSATVTHLGLSQSTASERNGRIRLDILLATGQRKFFDFRHDTKVEEVREEIWKTWPEEWPSRPSSSSALRLLHLGHILPDTTILGPAPADAPPQTTKESKKSSSVSPQYRGLLPGRTTVVHLLVKGGWLSEEERIQEEERERLKSQPGGSKVGRGAGKAAGTTAGTGAGVAAADEGQHGGSNCCCVIC